MFTKFTLIASIFALAAQAQTSFQIQSPASLIVCQPASLTFANGAEAPYYIAVLPGGQPGAVALEQLPVAQTSPVTWNVDLAAGTNVSLRITDGKGNIAYSSAVVIQSGSTTSCLSAASSGSSASASVSGAASASGSSATGSAQSSSSVTAVAAAASASASTTGAGFTTAQFSAGVVAMGWVVAAFGIVA